MGFDRSTIHSTDSPDKRGDKLIISIGLGRPCSLWRPTKLIYKHTDWSRKKQVKKVVYMHTVLVKAGTRDIPTKPKNLL